MQIVRSVLRGASPAAERRITSRFGSLLVPTLLSLGTAALYLPRLHDAPIYPLRDEMYFALTAHSLASSGRDPSGLFMPVYFPIGPVEQPLMWFQPMLMYATALAVRVLPFTESTIRLPMVAVAIVDVVLMYLLAKLLFKRELLAIAAAVLLALSPAHFVFSRSAQDYLAPLPFILAWLLCLLSYCRREQPRQLFAAGLLLGFGLYTYIASYILMPLYALLTGVVLYKRRDPATRYALLAAGFMLPAVFGVLFLTQHPAIIRDVLLRYEPNQAPGVGIVAAAQAFIHLDDAASLYRTYWDLRLLFLDGRAMLTGVAGVFLLPVAGALAVGVFRALRHFNVISVLLLGGLLSAPLPASFVNEPEAIRRALEILPFVVLLAVYGLDYLWSAPSVRTRRLAFLAMWCVSIYVAAAYREYLPNAQPFIRASTVPLALTGLAVLLRGMALDRLSVWRIALVSLLTLGIIQVAYYAAGYGIALFATLGLMAAIALAIFLRGKAIISRLPVGQLAAIVLLVLLASEFVYFYVDYSFIQRVGWIPASAQLLAIRFVCSGAVLIAAIGLARVPRGVVVAHLSRGQLVLVASLTLVAIQFAYFYIDYFRDYRARYLHASAVLLALTGLAMLLRSVAVARMRLGQLSTVALLGLASIQFTYFYADYFGAYRIRRSSDQEGNVRVAYETLLDRTRDVSVPAVYLSHKIEFARLRDLYWRFYVLKHDREELLPRTINEESSQELDDDRIRKLPVGTMVVTGTSPEITIAIDRLVSAKQLRKDALVRAADGVPIFWILERIGDGAASEVVYPR